MFLSVHFLKLNERIKELLEDKNRLKIDVRIVYGKNELASNEVDWLSKQDYTRTSFCKNLHAKCYINENLCIITSLNLYEFSQINNNEMGILLTRNEEPDLYRDALDEAQRIVRIGAEINILNNAISSNIEDTVITEDNSEKLTTSKFAKKLGIKTTELFDKLIAAQYIEVKDGKQFITNKGKAAGGEFKMSPKYGPYFIWPANMTF